MKKAVEVITVISVQNFVGLIKPVSKDALKAKLTS